jgi:hypothetical protein
VTFTGPKGMIEAMNNPETWLVELAALAASSPQIPELVPLEVGFEVSGNKMGLDLLMGRVTDGSSATSWLSGTRDDFAALVAGTLTMQRAHVTGRIQLSGDPEGLLRLAFLLDAAQALRQRQEPAVFDGASSV